MTMLLSAKHISLVRFLLPEPHLRLTHYFLHLASSHKMDLDLSIEYLAIWLVMSIITVDIGLLNGEYFPQRLD